MTDHLRPQDAALERLRGLHPKKIDLSLGRIERLLSALGDPHRRLPPVIHVAGTNGKGSTTAFLRAMAEAAGLRVHVYTSPHLVRFVERIRLAGHLITEDQLAEVLARVEAANAGEPITFFEITAAAAFLAFAETPADLLILEVGLGGRYDATNVIDRTAVSVIAPVDYDHKEFLGDDLAGIAREKAGILKRGAPAVVARQAEAARAAIEDEARKVGAGPVYSCGEDFDAHAEAGRLIVQFGERLYDLPPPSLIGPHQIANAGLAVAALLALKDDRITEEALARGVATAVWPARMQRLTAGPLYNLARARGADLWLDGAHNPHAAKALCEALAALAARDGRPTTLILGLLANKDAAGVLQALKPIVSRLIITGFEAEAAADPRALAGLARDLGLPAESAPDVAAALQLALTPEGPPPRIAIAGSLYLAGEVLALSEATWPS
jgi:dihydrofolate synthase / folylpolyglutamate synthase